MLLMLSFASILHLDSNHGIHLKNEIYPLILRWLNDEFRRRTRLPGCCPFPDVPFTRRSVMFLAPTGMYLFDAVVSFPLPPHLSYLFLPTTVPTQQNGYDCGIYSLRFFFGILRKRFIDFCARDVFDRAASFVTRSSDFSFSPELITHLRERLLRLLSNLSELYIQCVQLEDTDPSQDSDGILDVWPAVPSTSSAPLTSVQDHSETSATGD